MVIGWEVGAEGPHSLGPSAEENWRAWSFLRGLFCGLSFGLPPGLIVEERSLPKKSEARPWSVVQLLLHSPTNEAGERGLPSPLVPVFLWLTCARLPQLFPMNLCAPSLLDRPVLCGCAAGMGEADLLSNGDGAGEFIRRGRESKVSGAVSSPSLRPDINRLARGRRVVEDVVELDCALSVEDIAGLATVGRHGELGGAMVYDSTKPNLCIASSTFQWAVQNRLCFNVFGSQ